MGIIDSTAVNEYESKSLIHYSKWPRCSRSRGSLNRRIIEEWHQDHGNGRCVIGFTDVWFEDESTAVLFRLIT